MKEMIQNTSRSAFTNSGLCKVLKMHATHTHKKNVVKFGIYYKSHPSPLESTLVNG